MDTTEERRSNRIQIGNVPSHVTKEDLEHLVGTFGTVQRCDVSTNNMETSVHVTYETPDQAQRAVEQLSTYDYQGTHLRVDYVNNNRGYRGRPRNSGTGNRGTGYPLRILVPSDFVGAIIGKKGQTIRNITTQSRARVDVHRRENSGLLEKVSEQVISIYGNPENCTNACKEILKVMQQEATETHRGEITLKMLADDKYCGRIIGKEGKVIKKIREDTDTKILVSNVQDAAAMYPDRVITIRGTLDNMSSAEAAISTKLRECYENEMNAPVPPGMMMPGGMPGISMMPGVYGMRPPYPMMQQQGGPGFYPGPPGPPGPPNMYNHIQQQQQQKEQQLAEICQISIPNSAVGAIIGAGGSNIKQIIRDSNAYVTIEPKNNDDPNPAAERIVTIKGSCDAQWRACFLIFEKLRTEGFAGNEEVRLRTAIKVTKNMVGRVIGKGGKNVRGVQRMTGSMIKLPEDQASQGDEVTVEIFGNFMATQNAQSRIRALAAQTPNQPAPTMGRGGPRRGPRNEPN